MFFDKMPVGQAIETNQPVEKLFKMLQKIARDINRMAYRKKEENRFFDRGRKKLPLTEKKSKNT